MTYTHLRVRRQIDTEVVIVRNAIGELMSAGMGRTLAEAIRDLGPIDVTSTDDPESDLADAIDWLEYNWLVARPIMVSATWGGELVEEQK